LLDFSNHVIDVCENWLLTSNDCWNDDSVLRFNMPYYAA